MLKGQHEEDILKSVYAYHMVTTDHVTALHYATSSRRYVSSVLKSMVERKLLHCPTRPYVNLPNIYMLGIRGVRLLRQMGITVKLHPSEYKYPSTLHLKHLLITNDVLIACSKIPLTYPKHEIIDMRHDKTIRKLIDAAYKKEQIVTNVVADGLVVLREDDHYIVLWLEIDRGTEDEHKIRKKVRDIVSFAERDFTTMFDYQSFAVFFITTDGDSRRDVLRMCCERELSEIYALKQGDIFWACSIPRGTVDPGIFFKVIWRVPFRKDFYVPLEE